MLNFKNNNKFEYTIAVSILRIYVSFHIFKKYLLYFFNKETIYGNNSFINHTEDVLLLYLNVDIPFVREHIGLLLSVVMVLSFLFALGIGKNITCIMLFVSVDIVQRLNGYVLNGGDNFLKFILLYLCFTNCYHYFTLNKKKKICSSRLNYFSNIGVLCIKIHLCLIYFISAIFKINSNVWFNGIANYYILNLDRFKGTTINETLSKNYIFVTLSTYLTMFWELSFPYLVWIKRLKTTLIIIGVLLHLGIYTFFMFHDFEILFISTYILFFRDKELLQIKSFINNKIKKWKS